MPVMASPIGFISSARPSQSTAWPAIRTPVASPPASTRPSIIATLPTREKALTIEAKRPACQAACSRVHLPLIRAKAVFTEFRGDATRKLKPQESPSTPIFRASTPPTRPTMPRTRPGCSLAQVPKDRTTGMMVCSSSFSGGSRASPMVSPISIRPILNALNCSLAVSVRFLKSAPSRSLSAAPIEPCLMSFISPMLAIAGRMKFMACMSWNSSPSL